MADTIYNKKLFANILGGIYEILDQSSDKGFQKNKEEINSEKKRV